MVEVTDSSSVGRTILGGVVILNVLISVFAVSNLALAQTSLEEIDQYLGFSSFEEAFQTKDNLNVVFKESLRGIKSETDTRFEVVRKDRVAELRSPQGVSDTITKEEWTEWQGNYARALAEFTGSYGYPLAFKSLGEVRFSLNHNGAPTQVFGLKLEYSGKNAMGTELKGILILSKDLPGRAQMVYRFETLSGIEREWTLTRFERL